MAENTTKNGDAVKKAIENKGGGGGYDYAALTTLINDPNTTYEEREEAMRARSANPWAQGDISAGKRLQDMSAGKKLANEYIADGSLGRMQEGRSSEISGLIAERRKAYDNSPQGGLQAEELQAYRDQAVNNINRTSETARRRLAGVQAQTGVSGATAATQQMSAINAGNAERTTFERDLFLRQREALQQDRSEQAIRLTALESSVGAARANEEATQKFNLEQVAREKFGQLSTALSYAGLGATDRASASAIQSQFAAADAARPVASGGLLSKLF